MSKPVTDRALVRAWPGNGLPNAAQSRIAHGRKTRPATIATVAISRTRVARSRVPMPHATITQARPMKTASFRVSPANPMSSPSPMTRGSASRAPRGSARDAGHEQAGGEGEDRERHRRVGECGMEQERQVDRRDQPGPDRERPGATDRQRAFRGDVGGEPPGQDRHERPDEDRRPLGRRERRAEERHRDRREEGREWQPDLERLARELERRGAVAPQRVRDETAALEQVAGDPDVVGRVLRLGEDDLAGDDDPDHEGHDEDPERRQDGFAAGHGVASTG